jgi:hypothetical protein
MCWTVVGFLCLWYILLAGLLIWRILVIAAGKESEKDVAWKALLTLMGRRDE